jgi:hypothetical protein
MSYLPHLKNLVPSTEWQQAIIGAKEIVVTLFDTILQVAVGTLLVRWSPSDCSSSRIELAEAASQSPPRTPVALLSHCHGRIEQWRSDDHWLSTP